MKGFGDLMKQAREMQERIARTQSELEAMEITGSSGAGLVEITITGRGETRNVRIDPSLMTAEERETLEDLLVAAANDARARMERAVAEKMRDVTGGLQLPPGMDFKF